ncbi:hypothetical protein [Microbacterium sp.]|uniref:hypothetical protein n=1 Tax=Microbacterium sp. TaxID=51671 RepID=UPI0025FC5C49|nr:hypothetical protein [Microbacterium sp.]
MSTDRTRRSGARRRRSRAFAVRFAGVLGILAVLGAAGAAVSVAQGPRVTAVRVDPAAAIAASGSRMIITTTQSLQQITPEQVTVTPAAGFAVDTSGRSVGIRFALPLWDETEYTVTITGVTGIGGGPEATIEESFTTPGLEVFLLKRSAEGDTIFRTDLVGDAARPIFSHEHIEDFRATSSHLVVSTVDGDGFSHLIVTDLDGTNERDLPLPGDGVVSNLQGAERGDLIGYTFTDAEIDADSGRESALFTASPNQAQADQQPTAIERPGGDSRVDDWRFVPGTDSIVMLTFDGALTLASPAGGDPVALGNAFTIEGIARGSTLAVVQRADGPVAIDLATAEETPLPATDPGLGQLNAITPLSSGSTLRVLAQLTGFTVTSTSVDVVDAAGLARSVFAVDPADTLIETCVAPSGRYAAFLIAPDVISNPYDGYLLPLPARVETHVVALEDGTEIVALSGFDISWCQTPSRG